MTTSNVKYSRIASGSESTKMRTIDVRETPDFLFKVVIVGDSGVGKSCLLLRYVDDSFTESFLATIGVDFRFKTLIGQETNNKLVKLQLWDTAGQERFRTVTMGFFRSANLVLYCADLTDTQSFENLTKWKEQVMRVNPDGVLGCVIGTKSDFVDKHTVSRNQAEAYAANIGCTYVETSSKTGDGVEKAFEMFIPKMIENKVQQHQGLINNKNELKLYETKKLPAKRTRLFGFCNII